MITLVRAVQTCYACPSQWDAWDAEGQYYYLRYRHGHGYIRKEEADSMFRGAVVGEFSHGHPLDGYITLEEFCALAGVALNLGQRMDMADPDLDIIPDEEWRGIPPV
jgi:hypothetical protein